MNSFRMDDLPTERPAASFLIEALPWMKDAQCGTTPPSLWFDDVEQTDLPSRLEAISIVQDVCAVCPVRSECGEYIMEVEGGSDESMRFGFQAYMTPAQRVSVHRRGGLLGRDPMRIVRGDDGGRQVLPVPIEGDRWSRHHTTLARKVVQLLTDTLVPGEHLPSLDALAHILDAHPQPLRRVLDALVQDGTLDMIGSARSRVYTVRGTARAVPTTWLPLHLRHTSEH